jgi:hypothetical protein
LEVAYHSRFRSLLNIREALIDLGHIVGQYAQNPSVLPYRFLQLVNDREGTQDGISDRLLRHRSRNAPEQSVRACGKSFALALDAHEHFIGLL